MRIENLPKVIVSSPKKSDVPVDVSDKTNISDKEAKELAKQKEKQNRDRMELSEMAEAENNKSQLKAAAEAGKEAAEAQAKLFSDFAKCLKIAQRILEGNRVTAEDSLFLQENYPDLYKQSIMMRMKKSNPESHETISGEVEESASDSIDETQTIEETQIEAPTETESTSTEQSSTTSEKREINL